MFHISYQEQLTKEIGDLLSESLQFLYIFIYQGIETVRPRFGIFWRNIWMLKQFDYVVAYIIHAWGGAAQYATKVRKQGCYMIEISNL